MGKYSMQNKIWVAAFVAFAFSRPSFASQEVISYELAIQHFQSQHGSAISRNGLEHQFISDVLSSIAAQDMKFHQMLDFMKRFPEEYYSFVAVSYDSLFDRTISYDDVEYPSTWRIVANEVSTLLAGCTGVDKIVHTEYRLTTRDMDTCNNRRTISKLVELGFETLLFSVKPATSYGRGRTFVVLTRADNEWTDMRYVRGKLLTEPGFAIIAKYLQPIAPLGDKDRPSYYTISHSSGHASFEEPFQVNIHWCWEWEGNECWSFADWNIGVTPLGRNSQGHYKFLIK